MSPDLPDLNTIQQGIFNARELPKGFPFPLLRATNTLESIRNNPTLQPFLDEIRIEADSARSTPIAPLSFSLFRLFETTGDRSNYQDVYFDRRRRLVALVLATIVDETNSYLPALCDLLWQICNEYTWALPAHLPDGIEKIKAHSLPPEQIVDLFAAETAHTLAELLHILGNKLDGWLQYRIRTEIERRIFHPIFNLGHRFAWETASMNWAAVCGGCVGMAALLLEDRRERLVTMIDRMVRTMECFLSGFGTDGACPEGINYWVYGFGYFTYFSDLLNAYTDGALDLLNSEQIQRIVAFPEVVDLGEGNFINYSDVSDQVTIPSGLGSYLSTTLQQTISGLVPPDFHADPIYRWGHIVRDLLWTDARYLYKAPSMGVVYLDNVNWLIAKHNINGQTIVFSAKGGHNDEPHNHNDLGHFILNIGGESVLADLGAGTYTKQYFGEERYNNLHTGSQGHSVPVINGETQKAGSEYIASVTNYDEHVDGVTFSLDLTHAYSLDNLKSFLRSFEWEVNLTQNRLRLILIDDFEFIYSHAEIEECFISLICPQIKANLVTWVGKYATIRMAFDDRQMAVKVETLQTQTHNLRPLTVYRLRLLSQTTELKYRVTFDFRISLNF